MARKRKTLADWFKINRSVSQAQIQIEAQRPPTIVFLHGLNSNYNAFGPLKSRLSQHNCIFVNYNTRYPFKDNLQYFLNVLKHVEAPVFFLAHSLGGIYALHLSEHIPNIGGTTMASPLGGSVAATWMRHVMPRWLLNQDLSTASEPVLKLQNIIPETPWIQIVGIHDTVVKRESAMAHPTLSYREMDGDHFTVADRKKTIDLVLDHYGLCCDLHKEEEKRAQFEALQDYGGIGL